MMKSTKIATALALIATISTTFTVSARTCYDENRRPITCGVVRGSAHIVERTGEGALNALTLGGHERRKEEDRKRDEERKERERNQKKDTRRNN